MKTKKEVIQLNYVGSYKWIYYNWRDLPKAGVIEIKHIYAMINRNNEVQLAQIKGPHRLNLSNANHIHPVKDEALNAKVYHLETGIKLPQVITDGFLKDN